jgi:hypothetical protein
VFVSYPPFPGVTIGAGKVRASKTGAVKVKVTCPAGSVGSCSGTFSLAGAKVAFSVLPGRSKSVTVKLSKARLKALRKKKHQKLTATATAHDANGTPKSSRAKITLLAPR